MFLYFSSLVFLLSDLHFCAADDSSFANFIEDHLSEQDRMAPQQKRKAKIDYADLKARQFEAKKKEAAKRQEARKAKGALIIEGPKAVPTEMAPPAAPAVIATETPTMVENTLEMVVHAPEAIREVLPRVSPDPSDGMSIRGLAEVAATALESAFEEERPLKRQKQSIPREEAQVVPPVVEDSSATESRDVGGDDVARSGIGGADLERSGTGGVDLPGRQRVLQLLSLPESSTNKCLLAIQKGYAIMDKMVLEHLKTREDLFRASLERRAEDSWRKEVALLKAELEKAKASHLEELQASRDQADIIKAELETAREANTELSDEVLAARAEVEQKEKDFQSFQAKIPQLLVKARQEKEQQIRQEVIPAEIERAILAFKEGEMKDELTRAREDAVHEFEVTELPALLRERFEAGILEGTEEGIKSFPDSERGERLLLTEWGRGLMDYRSAVVHYHPDFNLPEVDRHFPELFEYAAVEGEDLPEIPEAAIPEPKETEDEDAPEYAVAPTLSPPV